MEPGGKSPGSPSSALAVDAPVRSGDGGGEGGFFSETPQHGSLLAPFGVAVSATGVMLAFRALVYSQELHCHDLVTPQSSPSEYRLIGS